ncbi:MAG: bifunctional 3,4-dihydroxy-2-butanone-4-phosphate synthase/GTP cyclohydrolase II [Bacillota bacterium]
MEPKFNTIEEALEAIAAGQMVVVCDSEDRENEGDLLMAADKVTPEAINFMATHGRGLICLPLTGERLDQLGIPLMTAGCGDHQGTAFTVSIDAREGTTTGISAHERALTILRALDPAAGPDDFVRPGHIFPLRAREGGVLRRPGHTEAAVDLARLAGLYPAGVICEVMNPDGTMARVPQLLEFAAQHKLKIITIADLVEYRMQRERMVERVATVNLPSAHGVFELTAYEDRLSGRVHVALTKGDVSSDRPVLVRVHSECLTGDVLGSRRCDCGDQLARALRRIEEEGRGVLLYMRQEGRGIGLANKIRAYALQDQGYDTVEANLKLGFPPDMRDYGIGAQILADLGVRRIRLMSNNPRKFAGLEGYGLEIVERIPMWTGEHECNRLYLETKRTRLGHLE